MVKHKVSGMRGWTDIGSDVSWDDHGGLWARATREPGVYYVIRFENMVECCGERDAAEIGYTYEASVYMLDLAAIGDAGIASALRSSGWKYDGVTGDVVNEYDGEIVASGPAAELTIVYACRSYGHGAPLETFTGNARPSHIRAEARRYAETCMRDAGLLAARLARPVNAIGSTAAEYGRGDITAAFSRMAPDSPENTLMLRLYGKL